MEQRKITVMINKAGGNASISSYNYRISLPSAWTKEMGITKESRGVVLSLILLSRKNILVAGMI